MPQPAHIPVLLAEVLSLLDPRPGDTALDCTAGLGGHALEIARRIGPRGTIILFDLDPANLHAAAAAVAALPDPPRILTHHANFAEAPRRLATARLAADVLLADLGFASPQVDDPARGFSFSRDGPLDMRLDPTAPITAAQLVNTLTERELAAIIRDFGEERHAARIAQKIVRERAVEPINSTARLAAIVRSVVGRPPRGPSSIAPLASIDPATRTFQALRIAVNDEQANLRTLLDAVEQGARAAAAGSPTWLAPSARIGIISFHSLEDRPVKHTFRRLTDAGLAQDLARRPVTPGQPEVAANPRARSARLRAIRLAATPPRP